MLVAKIEKFVTFVLQWGRRRRSNRFDGLGESHIWWAFENRWIYHSTKIWPVNSCKEHWSLTITTSEILIDANNFYNYVWTSASQSQTYIWLTEWNPLGIDCIIALKRKLLRSKASISVIMRITTSVLFLIALTEDDTYNYSIWYLLRFFLFCVCRFLMNVGHFTV